MRIALAVDGTHGDVFPMLALADRFQRAGHTVVLCGPPDAKDATETLGLEHRAMGLDARDFLTREARGVTGGGLRFAAAGGRYFEGTVTKQFERLPDATSDVDLILGAGLCFAGPSAAELHGIPYRFLTYCPVLLPSAEHPPFFVAGSDTPTWLNRLLWRFGMPAFGKVLGIRVNRLRRRLGLGRIRSLYDHLLSERPILAADALLAPLPADCPVEVQRIDCLHPLRGEPLPGKLDAFLAAGPPPVYFGFGSMTDPDPERTTRAVLRAIERSNCRAILSSGWAGLGDGPLPENVFRIGAVAHCELFPRVAAVVHHGGAGTTTTAARAGVPQVVVAHGADQYYWGARVHRLGLGPPAVPRRRLESARLALFLAATLENETVALRAREFGARMREAAANGPDPIALLSPEEPNAGGPER